MPDTFQLILGFSGFMGFVMSIVLFILHKTYPKTIQGLNFWSLAALFWGIAFTCFMGRGIWPQFFTYVLSNTFLSVGFAFFLVGLIRFLDRESNKVILFFLVLNALIFTNLMWFVYIEPIFMVRAWTMVCMGVISLGVILYFLIRYGQRGFGWGYLILTLGLVFLFWLARAVAFARGVIPENFHETMNIYQVMFVVTTPVATQMGLLGCIIIASEKLRHQLERKSRFDSLTNCLSRASILEEIQKEILRSVRQKSYFAVMMLDLDHFKSINDSLGHLHGDQILIDFCNRVTQTIRQIDRLGRLGGDEFVVLLPDTTEKSAQAVASRIQQAGNRGDHLSWQASAGIAVWNGNGDSLEALIERADRALYMEKANRKKI